MSGRLTAYKMVQGTFLHWCETGQVVRTPEPHESVALFSIQGDPESREFRELAHRKAKEHGIPSDRVKKIIGQ